MGLHILHHGELPIFFYGQNYMGALQAYLGAGFFALFGSSILTLRLVLFAQRDYTPRQRRLRYLGYWGWGLVAGLGLWSDMLVLPFILMSGLLLLLCCWREWRSLAPLALLLGLAMGGFPLIAYNVAAPHGQDSFSILLALRRADGGVNHSLLEELQGAIQVSIPTVTGSPVCLGSELSLFGPPVPYTPLCIAFRIAWGVGYLLLWGLSLFFTLRLLWPWRFRFRVEAIAGDDRQSFVRSVARLMLLGAAGMTLFSFIFSPTAAFWSAIHARYLIGLLIATPAILWPLWISAQMLKPGTLARWRVILCRGILVMLGLAFLLGTIAIIPEVPTAQVANQQQDALIHDLLRIGATHIYTDYWTCNRVAFVSDERIICGVLDNNLQPSHNRYYPYYQLVKADPHSAYVYPSDSGQLSIIVQNAHLNGPATGAPFLMGMWCINQK